MIAVCAWISVPFAVPFTMQTFGIFCTLFILGGKKGTIAVAVYILLGAVGFPVFSGFTGGIGRIFDATGGFIWGFLLCAGAYWIVEAHTRKKTVRIVAMMSGLIGCYAVGIIWYAIVYAKADAMAVISASMLPFALLDLLKLFAAYGVSNAVKRIGK